MKTFIVASSYILGTIFLGGSVYLGLSLAEIMPPPSPHFGGWTGGILPAFTAIIGCILYGQGAKFSRMPEDDDKPKPVEEFG